MAVTQPGSHVEWLPIKQSSATDGPLRATGAHCRFLWAPKWLRQADSVEKWRLIGPGLKQLDPRVAGSVASRLTVIEMNRQMTPTVNYSFASDMAVTSARIGTSSMRVIGGCRSSPGSNQLSSREEWDDVELRTIVSADRVSSVFFYSKSVECNSRAAELNSVVLHSAPSGGG